MRNMVFDQESLANLDAVIERAFSGSGIPGLAVGIVQDGKLVHEKCMGKANVEKDVLINATTAFRLGSISKTFTTVGLLQLWESGKLQLEDPVNNYLPKGKIVVKKGWPQVTFYHLLTHQAGIGEIMHMHDLFKPDFGLFMKGRDTHVPPLSTIHDKPLKPEVPAGTKYAYSNIGFSLLGYIIEELSGESFREYMVKHVLDPIGMVHSDFLPTRRLGDNEAIGYKRSLGRIIPAKYHQNILAPAGNLISSIEDMALYAATLLGKGKTPGGASLLKQATLEMAFTPRYWAHDSLKDDASIGLCFHLYCINGVKLVEHTGATSGFISAMSLVPTKNLAVLVFSNKDEIFGARRTLEIKHKILVHLLGDESRPRIPMITNSSLVDKAIGFYGPLPGVLTNTRILGQYGGDFKISARNGVASFSSLYGSRRKGTELIPVDGKGHFVIGNPERPAARMEHVAYIENEIGDVSGLAFEHFMLRRNKLVNTFRFKIYLFAITALVAIAVIVIYALAMH